MGLGFDRDCDDICPHGNSNRHLEGDRQTVRLPKSVHLPPTVFVRQDGESVVLEQAKPKTWPEGFFDSIRITDPSFERPEQGQLPPVKSL